MRVPRPFGQPESCLDDGWMHLHEVVWWVAWRGGRPEPKFGSVEFADGTWLDYGSIEEADQRKVNEAADEVRAALATGRLNAWAQRGHEAEFSVEPAHWARAFGNVVSRVRIRFEDEFDRVLVRRSIVMRLSPSVPRRAGRRTEHDWDALIALADAALRKHPNISRNALARSLVAEYRERVNSKAPDESTIRKKLRAWDLPPARRN
jgi:hypothetical protein